MKKSNKLILKVFVVFLSLMPFWEFAKGTHNEYTYKFITPDRGEEKFQFKTYDHRFFDDSLTLSDVSIYICPEGEPERNNILRTFSVQNDGPQIMTTTDLDQLANIFPPRPCNDSIFTRLNQWANFLPWPLSNSIFLYLDQQVSNLNSLLPPSGLQRSFRIPTFFNPANIGALESIENPGNLSTVTVTGIRQQTPTETTFSVEAPHFRWGRTYGSITVNRRAEVTHANFGLYGSVTLISSSYDVQDEQPEVDPEGYDSDYPDPDDGEGLRTGPCECCGCPVRGRHRSDYQ
ncbi:DUF1828 domain-containing protein [Endozoicomonas gorgoniicola]|uniref:DUF1828 domain-containing protein n=1 Tax=Endozoicomonas gorgoniicola TaxID=1234144 RepID=A0ABT3MSA6_9GAMM|nr:DUF1828 domain-containing protein [Endozoicomonas gorgoniicola]MCW7552258.1 DUF1828 domain-containing protein [Endozoicomonas gorgoniicola]